MFHFEGMPRRYSNGIKRMTAKDYELGKVWLDKTFYLIRYERLYFGNRIQLSILIGFLWDLHDFI